MDNYSDLSVKLIALSKLKGIGRRRVSDFLDEVYSRTGQYDFNYKDIIKSKITQLKKLVSQDLTSSSWDFQINKAKEVVENSLKKDIYTINFTDKCYPKELFVLDKKPYILFVKGNLDLLSSEKKVAIVGTREPSVLAEKMTPKITEVYSKKDYTVVSGLALGCDTLAQEIASIINGKTIAILAQGLDQPVYPKQNRELAADILRNGGTFVSEYPIGTKLRTNFLVERDQWQSGMSLGTIAIESSLDGGTRHASYKTLEQNRVLGMLDHMQLTKEGYPVYNPNDSQIGLNRKLISDGRAFPLYDLKSLDHFDKKMKNVKKEMDRRAEKIKKVDTEVINYEDKQEGIQTTLFEFDDELN